MTEKTFQITLYFPCQMFGGVVTNGVKIYIFFFNSLSTMEFILRKYRYFEERILHSLKDNGIKHRYVHYLLYKHKN